MLLNDLSITELEQYIRSEIKRVEVLSTHCTLNESAKTFLNGRMYALKDLLHSFFTICQ